MFGIAATIRDLLMVACGAILMFVAWSFFDRFDDAQVAREARKQYVAIAELEAEKARVRTAERLLEAERIRKERLEAERLEAEEALRVANTQLSIARQAQEDYQDEIEKLMADRPSGVPSVNDLGVKLRNR